MTKIYIVRHGYSVANDELIFAGFLDSELNETGLKQAQTLKEFFKDKKVDKVYSSDLRRAFDTVKVVADFFNLEVIPCKELRELYGGDWEGIKYEDIATKYPNEFYFWRNKMQDLVTPNGESIQELAERVSKAIREIAEDNDGKTVVIGTHGGAIRAFIAKELKKDTKAMSVLGWVPNCSVSTIEYENGKFKEIEIGNDKHVGNLATNLPKEV